ncbi:MAG: DUF3857 domain-containing protein [Mucilaginibacter sp.]|nr:DUF3857 domain-containing protein [Mucilaginibacter sp.]
MIKRGLLLVAGLLFCTISKAQSNYAAERIPQSLLPYASAVVRNDETTVDVKDSDNVIYHVKRMITVLNKNGDEKATPDVYYDKITSIRYIKGQIYNQYGKPVKKISGSDFDDYAVSDGFSLLRDDRVKHYRKAMTEYPYTIEYEYEIKAKQSMFFHNWEPQQEPGIAVEKGTYTFICEPGFKIRHKAINLSDAVNTATTKDGLKTYSWHVSNLKAIRHEAFSPNELDLTTTVMIAPEKFAYESFSGSFSNWQQLGKWMNDNLVTNREELPEQTIQFIKQLTENITDPKLKAKKIYEYMQQKTHYVSIQVGIGGWQPFLASDVDKDGYGDCKALVNYTKALLKAGGIESYYCVVYGNPYEKLSLMNDFASIQGNHIILCLPFKNDTTWLECTSQKIPFGFLGDFTDDRTVLAFTPEGGKLMHTPKYTADDNLEKRKASFVLNDEGLLSGSMETIFSGTAYNYRGEIIDDAPTERIKEIKKYYPINNMEVKKLEYKQDKSQQPNTIEDIELIAKEYGAVNDGKIYFSLNSIDRARPLRQAINRINPVCIQRGYTEKDDITYTLPKGYRLESELIKKHIDKPFGSFVMTMSIDDNKLVYHRTLQLRDGNYSKDVYQDLVDFFQSVVDADEYNVVLAKK